MRLSRVVILLLLAVVVATVYLPEVEKARERGKPWMEPVVTLQEVKALEWVRAHTPERTVFVSDIFGGEQLMGGALREGTEGGDWAIIANVIERMQHSDEVFDTQNASRAWQLARQYNASYVWAPNRQVFAGFSWKGIERTKFYDEQYFELAYADGDMHIYRVKEKR